MAYHFSSFIDLMTGESESVAETLFFFYLLQTLFLALPLEEACSVLGSDARQDGLNLGKE